MNDTARHETIRSFDGVELTIHRLGAGRPVLLLHGLFSDATMNWMKFGHAQALADAGFEAIMPDLRAHGQSGAPHDPAHYPPDVLMLDALAVVEALGLDQYDLVGFSLGARTAVRAVIGGLRPRRLVLAGMGLEGLAGWNDRAAFFIDAIDRFDSVKHGDPAFYSVAFMKSQKIDRKAARLLLQSVGDTAPKDLAALTMPTLVLCGDEDRDNGSPDALAEALPNASHATVPGTHMGSVTKPHLGRALVDYLKG
ncbi:4,5-9,10-diseco-3-hydroxy-5,9,17-trioxoandrosta-1(10),2-diene-4-oatehydrolase [Alteripontixanthobacter maritimus]|uniref:4,5-9,10-diseco-3-hydroxy-5,9, 17-trioxoandrosta-1(10),2-diene-4-oatehydrolase n=1 Tax=Alteripontixanthobacter maritimus TaxID=2161824 RepID=A0A369Q626_9SPHN|nr:alpha/beta fold hydrolase [Alteripontixanthobacter maritimus]RDC60164.1 4,5-9,10-diseco-3-hydroxy-5,9,17-trioxoandrosta-1(10),2-diene-4-oatehydrolase [Alteripontixanthobacter maritimus]